MKKHYHINERVRAIFEYSRGLALNIFLDELRYDNPIRHPTQKTYDEILDMYDHRSGTCFNMVTLTHREIPDPYYQLVLSIASETKDCEYFIWVDLTVEDASKLVEKFGLK